MTYDLSADLPHQQNENARRCRGCYRTMTTRCHAVCSECVDPATGFGCCPVCAPALVSA